MAGTAADGVAGTSRNTRAEWLVAQPATVAFIGLTLAGVLLQSAGQHVVAPPLDVVDRYGIRLVDVAAGEWWRVLTASFVSAAGWPHALLNAAGALLVAGPVEREGHSRAVGLVFAGSAAVAFAAGVWGHGLHWLSAGGSGLVLGCAGFIVARWSCASRLARTGAAVVLGATFVVPAALSIVGVESRGSAPAHVGGFVAGAAIGLVPVRHRGLTAAAVVTLAVLSLLTAVVPLLPGDAQVVGCGTAARSASARGSETRLLFVSDRTDVAVRWISPAGKPGAKHYFTADRRGRMPWYAYTGALYEVVDSHDRCLLRVRAAQSTSTVHIPEFAR